MKLFVRWGVMLALTAAAFSAANAQTPVGEEIKSWAAAPWAAQQGSGALLLIKRLVFTSPIKGGKAPRVLDPPEALGQPGSVAAASPNDVNFSLRINPLKATATRADVMHLVMRLAKADLIIEIDGKGDDKWHLTASGGREARDCPMASPAKAERARWVSCLGYDATIVDVRGDQLLAYSYVPIAQGAQGLLIKNSAESLLPGDTTTGDGLLQVKQAEGSFAILTTLTPRSELVRPGSKVVFEMSAGH